MSKRKTKIYKSRNKFTLKFILSGFLTLSFFASAVLNVHASEITAEAMIKLTNQSRAESGAEILSVNSKLARAAYLKAGDMLEFDYFDHISPSGIDPWYWIKLEGYNYRYAGENLAIDFITAEGAHHALMKSSSHRENILNSHFKEIGIAVLDGEFEGSNSIVVVEMFASPFYANKNEAVESGEVKNDRVELELKPELKLEPEPELKLESKLELESSSIPAPESEITNIPKYVSRDVSKEKELISESAPESATKKELDLLAVILAEKNTNLVSDYLAGGLYFEDNNEFFKNYKKGAVLSSADIQSKHSQNNFAISLLPLILGADLLFSLLIYKSGNDDGI